MRVSSLLPPGDLAVARDDDDLSLERRVDKHGWRLEALDRWRTECDRRLAVVESEVMTEKSARELRQALEQAQAGQGRLRLTRWQSLAAIVAGGVALADLVLSIAARAAS